MAQRGAEVAGRSRVVSRDRGKHKLGDADVPLDAFSRLLGRLPSEDERDRLRQARDALGIGPGDALWTVLLALQWHLVLYGEVPRQIERAAARATREAMAASDTQSGQASAAPCILIVASLASVAGISIGFFLARWLQ